MHDKKLARVMNEAVRNPIVWGALIAGALGTVFLLHPLGVLFGVTTLLFAVAFDLLVFAAAVWIAAVVWTAATKKRP
jgi:hypothetical protein